MGTPRPPATLQEQLAPLAARLRETRATIRPVSQVVLRLKPVAGKDRFVETVHEVLRWMDRRAGRRLPDLAWDLKSFELADVGAQRAAAVTLADPRYWAARLDDADRNVPLRTWVTEIGVGIAPDQDVLFGVRLICATRGADAPFDRTIPGFVRGVAKAGPAELDRAPVRADGPWILATEDDVDQLVVLLELPGRRAPVVVLALPEGSTKVDEAVCPASQLAERALGTAHVAVLTGPASYYLTDRMGRELSVFRQAARIYRPGFSRWKDQPARHPLFLPARVDAWRVEGWAEEGRPAFMRWLVEQMLASSIHRADRDEELPPFNSVRQIAAQAERERLKASGGDATELLALYEEDNGKLRKELEDQRAEFDGLIEVAERERNEAQQAAHEAHGQTFALRERIRALEKRLAEASGQAPDVPIPNALEPFDEWARAHLAGTVEIHQRALQGLKKSVYEDPTLVYRALLLLRDFYVPMKLTGGKELVAAFENRCAELKIEDSLVGDAVRTHSEQYTVTYGGRPRVLERHLKKGTAHNAARCFRLYYFWEEESQCVVVGWLPSHLDNARS